MFIILLQGLNELYDDLLTMETLVYECYIDDTLTFQELRAMPDLEKLQLIMSKVSQSLIN